MKIAVLDITARNAVQYNPALCNALSQYEKDVTLLSPVLKCDSKSFKFFRLLDLVPTAWKPRETKAKRMLRAIETLLNYMFVWWFLLTKRPDVLHIQWLPFIEFASLEKCVLAIFSVTCRTKFFLLSITSFRII